MSVFITELPTRPVKDSQDLANVIRIRGKKVRTDDYITYIRVRARLS